MDIILSLLFLLFVGVWLFPLIALMIKLSDGGPIFFKQKRYGLHNRIFTCIKFRTMRVNEFSSLKTTSTNDIRITMVGKVLRKTNLDETPQFINVLKGEMSVVGPRPHMLVVDNHYKTKIHKYAIRSLVQPGITGLAQVRGHRGDLGNMEIGMQRRILADYFYIKNWSLRMDLGIMLKTIYLLGTAVKG